MRRSPAIRGSTRRLHALPGRKLIFTNGTVAHAEKVLARLGVTHHFGDIFDIVHSDYVPKPAIEPYRKFVGADGDHDPRPPPCSRTSRAISKRRTTLGMTTVLVTSPDNGDAHHLNGEGTPAYVDHVTDDLPGFLAGLVKERNGAA